MDFVTVTKVRSARTTTMRGLKCQHRALSGNILTLKYIIPSIYFWFKKKWSASVPQHPTNDPMPRIQDDFMIFSHPLENGGLYYCLLTTMLKECKFASTYNTCALGVTFVSTVRPWFIDEPWVDSLTNYLPSIWPWIRLQYFLANTLGLSPLPPTNPR